jgi:hypothetical protein
MSPLLLGEWLYKLFMHQACVYETKSQYMKSHSILTEVVAKLYADELITQQLKEAIESYQVKITTKEHFLAYYIRRTISMSYDAMTTSPVESMNNHTKHKAKVWSCIMFFLYNFYFNNSNYLIVIVLIFQASTQHKTSKSLLMINSTNKSRFSQLDYREKRELQNSVLASKLRQKDLYTRKSVYIINELFDKRLHEKCVRTHHEAWIVWNFSKYKEPYFRSDTLYLKDQFPVFPTVYRVFVKRNANQSFLSCSCLHYDRCGIPCSHVLAITNELEDLMIKVEHWKVYGVYFGIENSPLSEAMMKCTSIQSFNEGYGTPISNDCLERSLQIPTERYSVDTYFNRIYTIIMLTIMQTNFNVHIHSNMDECYPHLMLGTSISDYKLALMVLQNKNTWTLKELQARISSCDAEEKCGDINEIGDTVCFESEEDHMTSCALDFEEETMTPCALDFEEETRSHLTRFDKQSKLFLSPQAKQLHRDLNANSVEKICMPTTDSLIKSRKNMVENIDYVKTYCDVENNPRIATIWADMERYIETKQNEARDILGEEMRFEQRGQNEQIVMSGITLKKKKPDLRLKGLSG